MNDDAHNHSLRRRRSPHHPYSSTVTMNSFETAVPAFSFRTFVRARQVAKPPDLPNTPVRSPSLVPDEVATGEHR